MKNSSLAARLPDGGAASLLVLPVLFVLFELVLPGGWPHPMRPDDYANVGSEFADLGLRWKRPVSANLIFLVAGIGAWASYLFLWTLAVVDAALVLVFVSRVFGVRVPVPLVLMFGVIVFSHVSAYHHATYLGLLTNLISHLFGMATLFALWRGWRDPRLRWWLLACTAYLLTALAKEDFLLPPVVLLAWLAIDARRRDPLAALSTSTWRRRVAGSAALVIVGVGAMWWSAHARNPFIAGLVSPATSSTAYAVDLSPLVVLGALRTLLFDYVPAACAAAVLGGVLVWVVRPALRLRVAWLAVTLVALALPYALISNSLSPFRAYAWLPWMAAMTVVAIVTIAVPGRGKRYPVSGMNADAQTPSGVIGDGWPVWVISGAVAVAVAWTQHAPRLPVITSYQHAVAINRAIVDTLQRLQPQVSGVPVVGLVGLGETSPWCAQDAAYVNGKLGFRNRWIVFVDAPTRCYTQLRPNALRKQGIDVSVVDRATVCSRGALPVIDFAPDGSGFLRQAATYCTATRR